MYNTDIYEILSTKCYTTAYIMILFLQEKKIYIYLGRCIKKGRQDNAKLLSGEAKISKKSKLKNTREDIPVSEVGGVRIYVRI